MGGAAAGHYNCSRTIPEDLAGRQRARGQNVEGCLCCVFIEGLKLSRFTWSNHFWSIRAE